MTQASLNVTELLTRMGEAYRASLPQWTPEEEAEHTRDFMNRLSIKIRAQLDAAGAVACCLCHRQRPRVRHDEPYYYPANECENARQPWHYHRTFRSRKADQREARRHKRRLRRGRPVPA
ncbi:hypothetical protein [Streptomyces drozdowiczii]